jgi:dihydroflavonol-4-reductase
MQVLVTGGTGFVGANIVAALNARGIVPRVLRRSSASLRALAGLEYEPVEGDVLDEPAALATILEGCEWAFHVAAVSDYWRQGREKLYRANVEGTRNMLAAAAAAGVRRFVFTSSLAAMGLPAEGRLLTEAHTFNLPPARFPYAHSKHLAELEVHRAVDAGLEAITVNPSIVLGPRDINLISGSLVIEAARGRLRFYPPGGANFIHVADVAAGHIAAAERGRPGERYILGAENLSHRAAIRTICEVVGRPGSLVPLPRWGLRVFAGGVAIGRALFGNRVPLDADQVYMAGQLLYVDNRKALQELDLPQTPFVKAVQATYEWYNNNGYLTGAA